ncbi:alpha/beta hydrolase [Poriferisphaera sp. WC338]|uniref:alpha/beta hydrolase n=1 Tax=Poriferisphaera sp. WC338 TaxID=3425129 RepID=UPI003D816810
MANITDWTLNGSGNQPIFGNTHFPQGDPVGVLVLSHGFKGYKDYGFFPQLAEAGAQSNLIVHRYNFSHSGMTNNIETFERPDLFEKDTWDRQVSDLATVLSAVDTGELKGSGLPIVPFGHSRGGITTLLTVARLQGAPANDLATRIAGVVTAASPDEACGLTEVQIKQIKAEGRLLSPSGRTGQDLYVGLEWYSEITHSPASFDPVKAAAQITSPLCIIHGNDDETIPPIAAANLAQAAGDQAVRIIIPDANHVFNAPNPLPLDQEPPVHTHAFMDHVINFAYNKCHDHDED